MIKMKILFSGGGTAGHINPALAIANYICERESSEIAFVGTREGLEAELIPRLGHKMYYIKIHGFERSFNLQNFKNIVELPKSVLDSRKILKEFNPDIVIGTGGYVCGPVLYAASGLGIPTLVHESNAYPGITTRLLSGRVDTVAVGARAAEEHIKNAQNVLYTGNPVRPEILSTGEFEARRSLGLDKRPYIVFFGGSMGARDFNRVAADWISGIAAEHKYQIIMGTGKFRQYDSVISRFKENGIELDEYNDITVSEYIYNMNLVMAAADLIVCRAGASTLSELTALGKPSILVPSPYVAANHQEHNARAVEKEGGARVILERDFSPETLGVEISTLVQDKEKLTEMRHGAKRAGTVNATEKIYKEVKRLTGR